MDRSMITTAVVAVIAILAIGLLVTRSPSGTTVPAPLGAQAELTASVVATGVTDLSGVQFDIAYDPAVVSYAGTTEGQFLDSGDPDAAMLLDTAQVANGRVSNLILLRVRQPGVDGTGNLATVRFNRIAPGDPGISLQNVLVSDSAGSPVNSDAISVLV